MELFLILSRENDTLPSAELKSVLEAENIEFNSKTYEWGIMGLEIPDGAHDGLETAQILAKRLGYSHEICQLLMETTLDELEDDISNLNWNDILDQNFAIRVKNVGTGLKNELKIDSLESEKKLGAIIKSDVGDSIPVKLEDPSTFIRVLIMDKKVLIGKRLAKIDKKHFHNLKPHKRPFFYPGSMSPKLARCMVNLSRIVPGDLLMDPFCGTGGILIEAGLLGARLIGSDIDWKMVKGTAENLEHCGIKDFTVFQSDARQINLDEKVQAVVTDPPYGISASLAGEESGKLYADFLAAVSVNMLEKGIICMATPHYVDVNELIKGTKFKILERHEIRMHKSLTRVISVMEKID
jgi:tRNA (guanine10-N2)-dimethyltransferase